MLDSTEIFLDESNADLLYSQTRNKDPFFFFFKPSLLNSADIINYVEKTAMLNPFFINTNFLKPASYSIRLQGKYKYWDSKEKVVEGSLDKKGDYFILKRNTLAFVTLETKLRLPHYIAARFNLQIKHVHRGILLGTGPLVDPGFKGNLFIPLHNLTNNDYRMDYLEPLIWMEFTKISDSQEFVDSMGDENKGKFFAFKQSSMNVDPYQYLIKAAPHAPIVNSVSSLVEEADKIQNKSEKVINRINLSAVLSIITLMIGLGTYIYNVSAMRKDSFDYVTKSNEKQQALEKKMDSLIKEVGKKHPPTP